MPISPTRWLTTPALLAAGAAVAGALSVSAAAPAGALKATKSAVAAPIHLSQGHVDAIDIAWEKGRFVTSVHDETVEPGVERDPANVVLVAKPQSGVVIPEDPAYAFLGAPGDSAWILPEVEDPELLFAGISTGELVPGTFQGDTVTIRVTDVAGPDGVSLFQVGPDGSPTVVIDSEDAAPDVITQPVGTHAHYNWAFEAPGSYALTYQVNATLKSGRSVTSDPTTIKFEVQP